MGAPGLPYLQICVKRIKDGVVSNYLHEYSTDGQEVYLSPPFGTFTSKLVRGLSNTTVCLLSAGIGVTPMLALLAEFGNRVALAAHVDRSAESFACRERFINASKANVDVLVHYT